MALRYNVKLSWFVFLLIASILLMGVPVSANNAGAPALDTPPGSQPGIYLVGSKNLDPAQFNNAGDMQFFWWRPLNPEPGVFNWTSIDSYLAAHAVNGKKIGIAIVTAEGRNAGGSMPSPGFVRGNPAIMYDGVTTNEVYEGDFENDFAPGWDVSGPVSLVTSPVFNGAKSARLGGSANSTAVLRQYTLRIPAYLRNAQFAYWWRMETSEAAGRQVVDSPAACITSLRSFCIRSIMKPGAKSCFSIFGPRLESCHDPAAPPATAAMVFSRSSLSPS